MYVYVSLTYPHPDHPGFAGELTMGEKMEALMQALYLDKVPAQWIKISWPSQRALGVGKA